MPNWAEMFCWALGLIQAVLPVDERRVDLVLHEERGREGVRPRGHGGVRELEIGFAVVEAVRGDREAAGREGAALQQIPAAVRVAAEDLVLVAEAVIAAEGEGPLILVRGRQSRSDCCQPAGSDCWWERESRRTCTWRAATGGKWEVDC